MGYIPTTRLLLVVVALSVTISGTAAIVYLAYAQRQLIEFHTIAWGYKASYGSDYLVINNQTTWISVWKQAAGNSSIPEVNFNNSTVLAVFAGHEPHSGYTINVTSVTRTGTNVLVQVTLAVPGENCIEGQNDTAPFHIVSVPKIMFPVQFATQTSARSC